VVFSDAWWLTVGVGDVRGLSGGVGSILGCWRALAVRGRCEWYFVMLGG
jgi:hypothetical protein